ncbi:MAG: SUMF1/EgtB/PvdO family nonheme iron enzyme [Gammaproteobacteria bacterium]|nr:SUMF1/EgtB/PvdO family nonheme iron enzyme [Gammaproteobacteria bacterium]
MSIGAVDGRSRQVADARSPMDGDRGESRSRCLLELFADESLDRLVLLGDPGGGKSAFVDWLTHALIDKDPNRLPETLLNRLVIRLSLRDVSLNEGAKAGGRGKARMLWRALQADISTGLDENTGEKVTQLLQKRFCDKPGVVLLDGLDEVPESDDRRKRLLQAVDDFLGGLHPSTRVLITARPYAYDDEQWRLPGIPVARLDALDEPAIRFFIRQWYACVALPRKWTGVDVSNRVHDLLDAIRDYPHLEALSERPLWLTQIALLHANDGRLPEDRADLYEKMVSLMLTAWQNRLPQLKEDDASADERTTMKVLKSGARELRRVLERVALQIHEEQGVSRSGDDGHPDDYLGYVRRRAGLLVERSPGRFGFSHKNFQEYPAACRLSNEGSARKRLVDWLASDSDWWREVFLLYVARKGQGGQDNQVDFLDSLLSQLHRKEGQLSDSDWQLARLMGLALSERRLQESRERAELFEEVQREVTGYLTKLIEGGYLSPPARAEVGDMMGALGDPRFHGEEKYCLPALYRGQQESELGFVKIPAGEFLMGSDKAIDKDAFDEECVDGKPHPQKLDEDFWIGRYPVTVGEYACFVVDRGYSRDEFWSAEGRAWREGSLDAKLLADSDREPWMNEALKLLPPSARQEPFEWTRQQRTPTRPVVMITWYETEAYCSWLDRRLHESGMVDWLPAGSGFRVRLPTEREWESAARSGHERIRPWIYPWNDEDWSEERANIEASKIGHPNAVGIYPDGATPLGSHDMAGNVWEWTASWWLNAYPYDPARSEAANAPGAHRRVLRGGSWLLSLRNARCAYRGWGGPVYWFDGVGFRVVLSLAVDS